MSVTEYYKGTDIIRAIFDQKVKNNQGSFVLHGEYTRYWRDGTVAALGSYTLGKRQGLWSFWYSNSLKELEVVYNNNLRSGTFTRYHENGKVAVFGVCANDEREGIWCSWYRDGSPKTEGKFNAGARVGQWKFWGESNSLRLVDYPCIAPK